MKKTIYIFAALVLASCSNDEVIDQNAQDASQITFDVTTNNATRATQLHSSTTQLSCFLVTAVVNDANANTDNYMPYFENVRVKSYDESFGSAWVPYEPKNGISGELEKSVRYWPNGQSLNFYAWHEVDILNADLVNNSTTDFVTESPTYGIDDSSGLFCVATPEITTASSTENQHDLLYAVSKGLSQTSNSGVASLNFRHALAQLQFQVKSLGQTIVVEISEISVCGINTKGIFKFSNSTASQYISGSTTWTENEAANRWVNVGTTGSQTTSVMYKENQGYTIYNTSTTAVPFSDTKNAFLVIPQDISNGGKNASIVNNAWDGVYLKVRCKIYNIKDAYNFWKLLNYLREDMSNNNYVPKAGDEIYNLLKLGCYTYWYDSSNYKTYPGPGSYFDTSLISYLWANNGGFADLYIPLDVTSTGAVSAWEAGKKYIYTLVFGSGDNIATDAEGNPVLVPMKLEATVDDWAEYTASDDESSILIEK